MVSFSFIVSDITIVVYIDVGLMDSLWVFLTKKGQHVFSPLKAFTDKSATTNTEGVSEILKPSPIKERAESSSPQKRDVSDEFEVPLIKLTWDEIYARISIILATVQPVKYHRFLGTGRRDDPLTIELSTEEPAVFGTWLKSGKDCMAIDKDGVRHWFRCDVKTGTLSYVTTFGCDYL